MARKLDEFPAPNISKYPWDEWLDGSVWELTYQEDFTSEIEVFRVTIYKKAAARGLKARTTATENTLTIQTYTDTSE